MKKSIPNTILLYILMWFLWAAWTEIALPNIPSGIITELLSSVAVKALIWVAPSRCVPTRYEEHSCSRNR